MRLIDGERLARVINRWRLDLIVTYGENDEYVKCLDRVSEKIEDAPTIEAEPVRLGHWIIDRKFGNDIMSNEQMVICSECKQGIFWGKQNYCPYCGAKMGDLPNEDRA